MMKQGFLAAFCLGIIIQSLAVEIKLADASASASVVSAASQAGYRISVEFRPVTTMDEISNREMSGTIAQFYAEEALSSFLKISKAIMFSKTRSTMNWVGDDKAQCVFDVPAKAIIDAPVRNVEIREEIVGKKCAGNKADASALFLDFRSTCFRDLRIAEALFAEKIASAKEQKGCKALRQKICAAFSSLRKKIKEDDGLFRSEKKDLVAKADKIERYLLNEIEGGCAEGERDENSLAKLPISEAFFKAPFGSLIKNDPILLTHGGARFIEMGDGAVAILAVGFAMADNEDREDIAELRASAELGKLQAGEESVVESRIERQYRRSSNGGGASESMEMKRLSKTVVNSIDFHKTGETVGTWLSADRKRFFMAKGRIVHKPAKEWNVQ